MKRKKSIKRISSKGKHKTIIDKLFRQLILKKRLNACEWCGKRTILHVSHILPKGKYPRLRYAEWNVLLLCYYCHMIRWHRNPLEAAEFLKKLRGKNCYQDLKIHHQLHPRMTPMTLDMIEGALKQEIERLEKEK